MKTIKDLKVGDICYTLDNYHGNVDVVAVTEVETMLKHYGEYYALVNYNKRVNGIAKMEETKTDYDGHYGWDVYLNKEELIEDLEKKVKKLTNEIDRLRQNII